MKIQTASELITTIALGTLSGLGRAGAVLKWHRLGLEAYLAHATQTYQKLYAKPSSSIHEIILWAVLALLGFALFKGLSTGIAGILSLLAGAKSKEQATASAD